MEFSSDAEADCSVCGCVGASICSGGGAAFDCAGKSSSVGAGAIFGR